MQSDQVQGLYQDLAFPGPPADRPYIYLNMVMSLDGRATIEGTERGLGSPRDQRLMRELRLHADMVMNGANTLRASGTSSTLRDDDLVALRRQRSGSPAPLAAVITQSADLPLERSFFSSKRFDAVVFAVEGAPHERIEAIRATGRRVVVLPASPDRLRVMGRVMRHDLGVRYLLVEGGPTLNHALLEAGLIDEIFLTVAAKIIAGANLPIVEGTAFTGDRIPQFEAVSHHYNEDDKEFYFRFRAVPA
jgi:riboflavin-specific deaminase-like protein